MAKSTKAEFTKYIATLDKAALEQELKKLYTKLPAVQQYYQLELSGDTGAIVNDIKEKIRKEYFPSRGFGKARSSVSRKYITDFKKVSVFDSDVVELLLFRVEMMLEFTLSYGDMDEPFYNSLISSFEEACKLAAKAGLQNDFRDACQRQIQRASGFGWGVSDEMEEIFAEYMPA